MAHEQTWSHGRSGEQGPTQSPRLQTRRSPGPLTKSLMRSRTKPRGRAALLRSVPHLPCVT